MFSIPNKTKKTTLLAITLLISLCADQQIVGMKRKFDETAIWLANQKLLEAAKLRGNLDGIKDALANGASIHTCDKKGWTALHHACDSYNCLDETFDEQLAVVTYLVSQGANIEVTTSKDSGSVFEPPEDDETPLHIASRSGLINIVKFLIANKANIETRDSAGNTPLMSTARDPFGDIAVIACLLEHGAKVNAQVYDPWGISHTALTFVCTRESDNLSYLFEIVKLLVHYKANIQESDITYAKSPEIKEFLQIVVSRKLLMEQRLMKNLSSNNLTTDVEFTYE